MIWRGVSFETKTGCWLLISCIKDAGSRGHWRMKPGEHRYQSSYWVFDSTDGNRNTSQRWKYSLLVQYSGKKIFVECILKFFKLKNKKRNKTLKYTYLFTVRTIHATDELFINRYYDTKTVLFIYILHHKKSFHQSTFFLQKGKILKTGAKQV